MTESQELYNDIAALVKGADLELVDFGVSRHKGSTQVRAVVYRAGGTGIDECSKAHKLIQARLDVVFGEGDFQLETASPGIDRTLASPREYGVFTGRGVRIVLDDEDVIEGILASFDGVSVVLTTADGDRIIPIERIRKGKLDYSQEGR
ncbi:MAG: ribosome assembly cofactor RimP [Spirochaetales bacterium]|nr:ribosome assembly cofactor RimP [Spirochaetales bacterium]